MSLVSDLVLEIVVYKNPPLNIKLSASTAITPTIVAKPLS